jgi:hypothetical protein
MDKEMYMMVQNQVIAFGNMLINTALPLDEFIAAGDTADSIGAIVDPTLYREAGPNMHKIMGMARALRTCQKEIKKVME